jgi:malonate-semialdehyde dehydrogenase (acetylating) / methylmalonate-semialdehyde dehydrogenase
MMHRRTIPSLRTLRARSYAATAASRPPLSGLSASARPRAEKLSAEWKGTSATGESTKNFIGGEFVESKTSDWIEVVDPVCVA